MYKKIHVPLDGSQLAEVALPYAEELSARLGSEVTLLYVTDSADDLYNRMHQLYMEKISEYTKRGAERYLERPEEQQVKVETKVLVGNPGEEIIDYAENEKVDLIIMATHGRSGIRRWAMGSIAYKVIRQTNRPILLIRARGARADVREKGILKRILVLLDGSKDSEAILPYVEEIALTLKTEIILLHMLVREPAIYQYQQLEKLEELRVSSQQYIENIATKLQQKGITARFEFKEVMTGTEVQEIIKLSSELEEVALAMSSHGQSGIGRRGLGSIAEKVLHEGKTPLLLVRPGKSSR